MEHLGSALRFLRNSRQLTQRATAAALGIPPSTVSAWEMSRRQPSLERLGQLADLLELDLGDLDDALELAGAFPLPRRQPEVVLAPQRIAQVVLGQQEIAPRDPLKVLLEQLFALVGRLRERGFGEPRERPRRPAGVSRMATLPDALYILRTSHQMSRSQIGEALKIHRSVVSAWERGKRRPSLARFGEVADVLRLDLGEFDNALERMGGWTFMRRRRRRRPLPEVELEPARIAARLLGRLPGDPGDSVQDGLKQVLEQLFVLVGNLQRRPDLREPPSVSEPESEGDTEPAANQRRRT
jgi:transcriptional regulator with XRE-family HTH domain